MFWNNHSDIRSSWSPRLCHTFRCIIYHFSRRCFSWRHGLGSLEQSQPMAMATQDSVGSVWSIDWIIISGTEQSVHVWRRRRCWISSWPTHPITRISSRLWWIRLAPSDLGWRITTSSVLVCGIWCGLHMVEDEMVRIFWSIFCSGHSNLDKYSHCLRQPQAH